MIFSGPSEPKFICEAFVVSERVGDGGPSKRFCPPLTLRLLAFDSRERVLTRGMLLGDCMKAAHLDVLETDENGAARRGEASMLAIIHLGNACESHIVSKAL